MSQQPYQQPYPQPAQQPQQGGHPSAADVLFGSGVPAAPTEVGVEVGGVVVAEPRAVQEREFDPANPGRGAPKFYPSGDPVYGLTIDVQTTLRDPFNPHDNGVRRVYVSGKRCTDAVRQAVEAAGVRMIEVGGALYVTKGDKVLTDNNVQANTWTARYVSKAQTALTGPQSPQAPPQPMQQQQTYQPQQQPQGSPYGQQPAYQQQPAQQPAPQQQPQQGGPQWFGDQQQGASSTPPQGQPATNGQPTYTREQIAAAQAAGITLPGV